MKQAVIKLFGSIAGHLHLPEPLLIPINRDVIADAAIETAIREGELLAQRFTDTILAAEENREDEFSEAIATPLSIIPGGNGDGSPGSLLKAACVGAACGLGFRALSKCYGDYSQVRVMDWTLAKEIAKWEVGEESAGRAPLPWNGDFTVHLSYSPGTLTGGKFSVAHKMEQYSASAGGWDCPPQENAALVAQVIAAFLGLAEDPWLKESSSPIEKAGIWLRDILLSESTLNALTGEILKVDLFWPENIKGRRLSW